MANTTVGFDIQPGVYYNVSMRFNLLASGYNVSIEDPSTGTLYWANGTSTFADPDDVGVVGDAVFADSLEYQASLAHRPRVNDSTATPTGPQTSPPTQLSIDVSDADFASSDGDRLFVEFFYKGPGDSSFSSLGMDTLDSNGTATISGSFAGGGKHEWYAVANDSYSFDGQSLSSVSDTFSFKNPVDVKVHDGDAPSTLLDDRTINAEIVGTDADSNFRTTRSTNNGTLPLRGLPDEDLRVRLNATGYAERVIIAKPYGNETRRTVMYNLSNATTYEQCFQLDSRGAGFAPDTTQLVIQTYLDGQWSDSTGQYFGAANLVCSNLEDGEDYRLKVTDGRNTRNLGGYEADVSFQNEVITLVVDGVTFGLDRGKDYRWQAQLTNESGSPEILFKLDPQDQDLNDLSVTVWERGSPSTVLDTIEEPGSIGVYAANFPLTSSEAQQEWVVNWTATYPDGSLATGQTIVSLESPATTLIPPGTPSEVVLGLAVGIVILLAMVFSQLHAGVGMGITVAFAGLLVLLGVLPVSNTVLAFAIGLAVVGYVGFGVLSR